MRKDATGRLRDCARCKMGVRRLAMAETAKCAHPACTCMVDKGGPHGKYCSEHCKEKGQSIELRCDCMHPGCR
jgi:hypothetical protein